MKQLTILFFLVLGAFGFGQSNTLFEQGNDLYNAGKYQEAINSYEAILEQGEHSAELYYNLANAYYKLNSIAPSIYYYEKALQLNPHDNDIQNNAAFARNMTIDAIDTIPEVGFTRIMKTVTNSFTFDQWAIGAIVLVFGFVMLFLMYYFSYTTNKKRILFLSSGTSLMVALIALFFAFQKFNLDQKDHPAIIFAKEAQVKTEPNLRSEEAFRLHEGTKVQILEALKDWNKIKLSDGKTGWIPSEDLRTLRDF
jgi:tetratricopeptide (TPR) repeat protein